ncbi:hypothetical protein [Deinococcus cellulosilyticus]|uniref:Uncharacterized protein n=1 Tax=Deinococcus cellulosilyticus (strain DSM 18568 / NBRC 106333 / KACC 11606 / 5516J-15) TaxID=1223518 RepID=A0A511N151_DEIC1|nr:hypothetical protein [Deinococcus cellulosilyticus]GEM46613.1 hypothetical protein DC3_22480 [Deinococcus cellulosilyticus NBRC 106333 = KACC 11606]
MLKKMLGVGLLLLGVAQAKCDSPYFPVREGWVWTYQNTGTPATTYQQTYLEVGPESFTQRMKFSDGNTLTSNWTCTENGYMSLNDQRMSGPGMERFKVSNTNVKGSRWPLGTWNVGTKWSYEYSFMGSTEGMDMTFNLKGEEEVVGQETVTVPAGTFTAWKLKSRITTSFTSPMLEAMKASLEAAGNQTPEGMTIPVLDFMKPVVTESTSWVVEGVGTVKSVAEKYETVLVELKK